ncbi:MAG: hypothetical protein KY462_02905 [Actinobacteria bacterium]|nr:hypothetical protein [Actinomycetota bacterium]
MKRSRGYAVVAAMLAATLIPAAAAAVSCVRDDRPLTERLAEFEIVFVGTVTDVADERRAAWFRVEEIWRGPDLDRPVVRGGPGDPGTATSVDRTWEIGQRYLVAPRRAEGGLVDDRCSPTQAWRDELARARPEDARVVGQADTDDRIATAVRRPWTAVVAVALVLAFGGYALWRRHA